jgi:transporter family-2 protein
LSSFLNNYLFIILAILAGMAMPTQATVNGRLATYVGSPIIAAFISFAIGTVALFAYIVLTGIPLSSIADVKGAPIVVWIGGFLGAFFVAVMAASVPRIGVALAFSLAIGGQMIVTLILDHFGWLGVPEHPINFWRVLGAIFITTGVVLIRTF